MKNGRVQRRAESLRIKETRILEAIASGASLSEVLTLLCRSIEEQVKGMFCSILLLDEDGMHLRHGAAPSLPEDYSRAVDGVAIGPNVGSCGTAAYLSQTVIVADIATDPLWANFRDLALGYGLRACWSTPIFSSSGKTLGTFAMYYTVPRKPSLRDRQLIERASYLAGIAIERQRAEDALRESESRYRELIENANDIIYTHDLEGNFTSINGAAERITGYNRAEIVKLNIAQVLAPEYIETARRMIARKLMDNAPTVYEVEIVTKDGRRVPLEVSTRLVSQNGKAVGVQGVARDISARKQAEQARREAEAVYHSLVESLPQCIFRKDVEGRFTFGNSRFCASLGKALEEIIGKTDFDFYPAELARKYRADDLTVMQSGEPVDTIEEHQPPGGEKIYVHVIKTPLRDSEGKVIGIQGIFWDVTAKKRAEDALAAEKELLAVTLRSIGDGVIATDTQGNIVLMNRVAEQLTGWQQKDAIGKPLHEVFSIIHEKTRRRCDDPVTTVLRNGGAVELTSNAVLVAQDRTERFIAINGAPLRDRDSRIIGVVVAFNDVTEKRKMEAELLKIEKLESLGVLAGGIAHDFNNILTAILGNISLATMYADPQSDLQQILTEAESACLRARDLTMQLLTFARGGAPIIRTASIANLLQDATRFTLRGSNVKCEFDIAEDLWAVQVDEGQISQVIHNLVINAQQAMPQGGTVKVTAENVAIGACEGVPLKAGRYVKISIEDSGIGIPEEHLSKIFDPYFTTKQKGTGLGLASAYSIIKNHDGYITVESELGVGTTFHVYLPASPEKVEPPKGEMTRLETSPTKKGRILVMDDEEVIRDITREVLTRMGYEAEFAREGMEAVEMYRQAQAKGQVFDAVIMDLTVPGGMGGKEATRQLLEIDPHAKVIVSSGYSNDPIMANYEAYGFCGVVAKPYKVKDLVATLQSVIANGRRSK
ncbi:MAG: PAS domain S-box protein [Abditibacteriales bacterium]|nr:PAS domain S-box protein [Abditibacteriales bacterium]MDW8364288.1 PAS domain S-box protein [Abditibacteriales bacterium]